MAIAQRVQVRHDDVPLGEQTVSQVSVDLPNETNQPSDCCRSVFLSGSVSFDEFRWIDTCKSIVVLDRRFHLSKQQNETLGACIHSRSPLGIQPRQGTTEMVPTQMTELCVPSFNLLLSLLSF